MTRPRAPEDTVGSAPDPAGLASDPALETTPVGTPSPSRRHRRVEVGQSLGRYVVIEVLGKGAMGEVLRVYDPKLRRELAVKRIVPTRLSSEAEARLVREAQAMAQLTHPNVVAVYDVDVTDDGVLVAMEYVRGGTLGDWLAGKPGWRDIVRVFAQAGRGLHAAHESGLVHRDFKPANVLVADDGRVRVADFGLVKVAEPARSGMERSLGDASVDSTSSLSTSLDGVDAELTAANVVLGTPRYMAPEQHAGPAEAASDQFSFCIALWEALVGRPPYEGSTLLELAEGKFTGPPAWPREVAVPRKIVAAIERGLAPKMSGRHPSMAALVDALESGAAARRRQLAWAIGSGAVAIVGTLAVVAASTTTADKCTGAAERIAVKWNDDARARVQSAFSATKAPTAESAWTLASERLDAFAEDWATHYRAACEATAVRGEQSDAVLDLRMGCLDRARGELGAVVGVFTQADATTVERAHRLLEGLPDLQPCDDVAALQQQVAPPPAGPVAEAVASAREDLARARALYRTGRYEDSLALADDVRARTAELDYAPIHAEAELGRGDVLDYLGRYDDSEAALQTSLQIALREGAYDVAIQAATSLVYVVGGYLARPAEAQWPARMALDLAAGTHAEPVLQARARNAMGYAYRLQSKWKESEAEYRHGIAALAAAVGERDSRVATLTAALGAVLTEAGAYDRAEPELRRAWELRRELLGPDHPDTANSSSSYGFALYELGRFAEAEKLHREALEGRLAAHGPEHFFTARARGELASTLAKRGKLDEALTQTEQAWTAVDATLPAEHPGRIEVLQARAFALQRAGRLQEAEAASRRAMAISEAAYGGEHPLLGEHLVRLAALLLARGAIDDAAAVGTRALAILEPTRGKEHLMTMRARAVLGEIQLAQGHHEDARAALELAWAWFDDAPVSPDDKAGVALALARTVAASDPARAHQLARRAIDDYTTAGPGFTPDRDAAKAWLADRGG